MELRTARLVLRPVTVADAEMVQRYRGSSEVVTYLTHPVLDLDETRRRLTRAAALWSSLGEERFDLRFAVVRDGAVIGDVRVWNAADPFHPAPADPTDVWVGYAFDPRHQGRGYATEAVGRIVAWLFDRGAERILANCYADNAPSLALLRRLGFTDHLYYPAEQDESGKNLASCRLRLDRAAPAAAGRTP